MYNIFRASLIVKTRWGQVTHIYVFKLNIIRTDNGLSPGLAKPLYEPMLEYF